MSDYNGRIIFGGDPAMLSELQLFWTPAVGHDPQALSQLNEAWRKMREEQMWISMETALEAEKDAAEQWARQAFSPRPDRRTNEFTPTGPVVEGSAEQVE